MEDDLSRLVNPGLELPLLAVFAAVALVAGWVARRSDGAATSAPPSSPPAARVPRPAIAAALLVALALALPFEGQEPLDHLEQALVVEVDLSRGPIEVFLNRIGIEQAHQPLSRLAPYVARSLGWPRESARWFALACWLLAIPVAAAALAGLAAGALPASMLTAAFLWVVVSPLAVRYAFDATPYALLALLAWMHVAATGRVAAGAGRGATALATALAVSAGILAFYTHYVAVPLVAGTLGHAWLTAPGDAAARRRTRARLVVVGALFAIGVVPWLPAMRLGVGWFDAYVRREANLYALPLGALAQTRELLRIALGAPGALVLTLVTASAAVAAVSAMRSRGRAPSAALAVPLVAFGAFKLYHLHRYREASGGTYFGARHFLPFLPFLTVWLAVVAERAGGGGTLLRKAFFVLPALALASSLVGRTRPMRPDVRTAAELVREGLEDGDAVGVLPRFFYSFLVVEELTHGGGRSYLQGFGFVRLESLPHRPRVWLVADDREVPLPAALENRAFERIWIVDFREEEFGLAEISPEVSRRTIAYMDAHHRLLRRVELPQLVLHLYALEHHDPPWPGGTLTMTERDVASWAGRVSWTVPTGENGAGLTYRIDLPPPARDGALALTLSFGDAEGDAPTTVHVELEPGGRHELTLPAGDAERTVVFDGKQGTPIVVRLSYDGEPRVPGTVVLRDRWR